MKCNQCGNINKEGSLFCSQCGNPLNKEEIVEENVKHEDVVEVLADEIAEENVTHEEVVEVLADEIAEENTKHEESTETLENEAQEETLEKVQEEIYCEYCKNKIFPTTVICPHCGSATGKTIPVSLTIEDKRNIGLDILSLLSPLFGIFAYLIFKDKLPKLTKSMKNFSLIGIAIILIVIMLSGVLSMFGKERCKYTDTSGQRCSEEVYEDGYCQYHYFTNQNPFFQNF